MPIPELVDYIQAQTQEGVTAEDLRVTLMETGWSELDIDNALHDVAAGLHPATPGASIHEDLAQVRGMVAHLASRVKGVEAAVATLTTSAPGQQVLPAQMGLPTGFIGADHELPAAHRGGLFMKLMSLMAVIVLAVVLGVYVTNLVGRNALAPRDHLIIAGALGAFFIVVAIVLMRQGRSWSASLTCAVALTLWVTDIFVAWRVYHYMEWTVALGLGVLFVVIALVMGRWTKRLARS